MRIELSKPAYVENINQIFDFLDLGGIKLSPIVMVDESCYVVTEVQRSELLVKEK